MDRLESLSTEIIVDLFTIHQAIEAAGIIEYKQLFHLIHCVHVTYYTAALPVRVLGSIKNDQDYHYLKYVNLHSHKSMEYILHIQRENVFTLGIGWA